MSVYLSGPMRGIPNGNRPAFEAAAARLRKLGYLVWSPIEHDDVTGVDAGAELSPKDLKRSMTWDQRRVMDADIVVFLPGWRASRGAKAEFLTAWYQDKLCYCGLFTSLGFRLVPMPDYDEPLVTLNRSSPSAFLTFQPLTSPL